MATVHGWSVDDLVASVKDNHGSITSSTAGDVIPPMHIFSGQRFQYNPLEDGVNGAYSSIAGWPITLSSAYCQFGLSFYLSMVTQPTSISKVHMEKVHVFMFIACLCIHHTSHSLWMWVFFVP